MGSFGLFLSLVYSLFFYNRVFFGRHFAGLRYYADCTRLEFHVLFVLASFLVFYGLWPNAVFALAQMAMKKSILVWVNF